MLLVFYMSIWCNYFTANWYKLWLFGIFSGNLVYISQFFNTVAEKSGNPVQVLWIQGLYIQIQNVEQQNVEVLIVTIMNCPTLT
jgi:hypothetical protein